MLMIIGSVIVILAIIAGVVALLLTMCRNSAEDPHPTYSPLDHFDGLNDEEN